MDNEGRGNSEHFRKKKGEILEGKINKIETKKYEREYYRLTYKI
jgi:hypothetical protein